MSCGVGDRRSLDPTLLWLWRRPLATALIRPLAWELPYAAGAALEKAKRKKENKNNSEILPLATMQLDLEGIKLSVISYIER